MAHLPALCARYPAFCWTWFTDMEPVSQRYAPGWFHIGASDPHDGHTHWVEGDFKEH